MLIFAKWTKEMYAHICKMDKGNVCSYLQNGQRKCMLIFAMWTSLVTVQIPMIQYGHRKCMIIFATDRVHVFLIYSEDRGNV